MPDDKLPIKDFAAKIKAKYPEYANVNDTLLTQKILAKYPEYNNQVDMSGVDEPVKKKDASINGVQGFSNGVPSEETIDPNDIVGLAKQAKKLSTQTTTTADGLVLPDADAIKQGKDLTNTIKQKGYTDEDINGIAKDFEDYPEAANGFPESSKQTLLDLRKSNPIKYQERLNTTKTAFGIEQSLLNKGLDANYVKGQFNLFNNLNEAGSLPEYINNKKKQAEIINQNLDGDQKDKALEALKENGSKFINSDNPELVNEYNQSDLKDKVDVNQYAGLKTLETFDPEKYKQAVKMLKIDIVPEYEGTSDLHFGDSGFTQDNYREKETEETINQRKGLEKIRQTLSNIGRNNSVVFAKNKMYDLDKAYTESQDPEEKNKIAQQYLGYKSAIDRQVEDAKGDDAKYPLSAEMKFHDQVNELTQSTDMSIPASYLYHTAKGFSNTGGTLENLLVNAFGSSDAKTRMEMERLGEFENDQSIENLPSRLKSGLQTVPVFSKEIQKQAKEINDDNSIDNEQKKQKLNDLVQNNQDGVDYQTKDIKHNFLSASSAYRSVNMLGDITSFAVQTALLGGAGASKTLAAALPMYTATQNDFYKEAIANGEPNPESYANVHALIMAAAGMINPDLNIVKRTLGLKTAAGRAIAGIDEATWKSAIEKNKPLLQKFTNALKSSSKEAVKMAATYGAGTSIASDLADKGFFNKDISSGEMIDNAISKSKSLLLDAVPLLGMNAITNFRSTPFEQKAQLWEASEHPDITNLKIDESVKRNEITAAQGEQRKKVITDIQKLKDKIPAENKKGKPLTDREKVEYLYNQLVKTKANDLKGDVPEAQKDKIEGLKAQADESNNHLIEGTKPKLIEIKPDETHTYTVESEKDLPKVLLGVKPIEVKEIETENGKKTKHTYSGQQLIDVGLAQRPKIRVSADDALLLDLGKNAKGSDKDQADAAIKGKDMAGGLKYFSDKAAEDPIKFEETHGKAMTDRMLERSSTEKLNDSAEFLLKLNPEHPGIQILEKEIEKRNGEENKTPEVSNEAEATITDNGTADKVEPAATGDEEDSTSIKNETTRAKRELFGLKEEDETIKKDLGTSWDEAKQKISKGYHTQDLIDELKRKPRPIDDVEVGLLLHHQNSKEMELLKTNEQINEAATSGDTAALEEAKVRRARLKDELQDIYDVDKAAGTETARGLSARQMMVDRKYNLINMESEVRAANDGKPLTPQQEKDVEALHKKIKDTQGAFDEYVEKAESEIKSLQEKILGKGVKDKKTAAQKLRELANKVEKSKFGKAELPEGTQSQGAPIDINKMVAQAMRLVADGIEKGGEILDVIKKAIEDVKAKFPDVDEKKLNREVNKSVIESGIIGNAPETKKLKDLSDIFEGRKLDRVKLKLKAENQRAKDEVDILLKRAEAKKRTKGQKVQDAFIKWQRAFKLSNPVTMGKLVMAGVTRLTMTPAEDLVGAGLNAVLPKSLTSGAIGEGGGLNIRETAAAYKKGIIEGMKDAWQIMKRSGHGKSELDTVFGKSGQLPPEAIDFFGQLHSATKAPFKRFAFERSLSKRFRRNIKLGVDVSDPMVQTEIAVSAYKDANRAIFMQDNKVTKGWQRMVDYFDRVDPKTGEAPSKLASTTLQWLVPFVKVPTNIASEIGTNVYGVPVGIGKIIYNAFGKGLENLSADQKDVILRNLKKGSLGAAALTLGYMNPQMFGGYYQDREKRSSKDAKANSVKLFGINMPAWLIESPIFQAMEIGATVRRVKDAKVKGEEKGILEGTWAGALGLAEHVPMIDQPLRIFKAAINPKERDWYIDELAKSTIEPAALQKVAEWMDGADKRTPTNLKEHLEMGIPGLRENVSAKKQPFTDQDNNDPVFKYFLDKGMELPNTAPESESIKDQKSFTTKKLNEYPQDVQDKYADIHKKALKQELSQIERSGSAWVNPDNNASTEFSPKAKRVKIEDLTKDQLADLLSIAQKNATAEAKFRVFKIPK